MRSDEPARTSAPDRPAAGITVTVYETPATTGDLAGARQKARRYKLIGSGCMAVFATSGVLRLIAVSRPSTTHQTWFKVTIGVGVAIVGWDGNEDPGVGVPAYLRVNRAGFEIVGASGEPGAECSWAMLSGIDVHHHMPPGPDDWVGITTIDKRYARFQCKPAMSLSVALNNWGADMEYRADAAFRSTRVKPCRFTVVPRRGPSETWVGRLEG